MGYRMRMRMSLGVGILAAGLLGGSIGIAVADDAKTVTVTGWIACQACSAGRVEHGASNPPNNECARKCIREGSPTVFYDEASKKLLRVDNPKATEGKESDRIEVTGTIDAAAGTIHVASLKVLQVYVSKCSVGNGSGK